MGARGVHTKGKRLRPPKVPGGPPIEFRRNMATGNAPSMDSRLSEVRNVTQASHHSWGAVVAWGGDQLVGQHTLARRDMDGTITQRVPARQIQTDLQVMHLHPMRPRDSVRHMSAMIVQSIRPSPAELDRYQERVVVQQEAERLAMTTLVTADSGVQETVVGLEQAT